MKSSLAKKNIMPEELRLAIGLVWGHLNARQFHDAYALAKGCLAVWPGQLQLEMMLAYATIEIDEALSDEAREALLAADCEEWAALVFRRAGERAGMEEAPC